MNKIESCIYDGIRNYKLARPLPKKFNEESLRKQFLRGKGVYISSTCWDRDGCFIMFSYATLSPLDLVDDAIKNDIINQINTYEISKRKK